MVLIAGYSNLDESQGRGISFRMLMLSATQRYIKVPSSTRCGFDNDPGAGKTFRQKPTKEICCVHTKERGPQKKALSLQKSEQALTKQKLNGHYFYLSPAFAPSFLNYVQWYR